MRVEKKEESCRLRGGKGMATKEKNEMWRRRINRREDERQRRKNKLTDRENCKERMRKEKEA